MSLRITSPLATSFYDEIADKVVGHGDLTELPNAGEANQPGVVFDGVVYDCGQAVVNIERQVAVVLVFRVPDETLVGQTLKLVKLAEG